jgi:hypothetical protein
MRTPVPGWIAVAALALISSFWAFWGANEAFHEGWYEATLTGRVAGALRYLAPALLLMLLGLAAVRWPRLGAALFLALGLAVQIWIWTSKPRFALPVQLMFTLAPVLLGVLHLLGPARPQWPALLLTAGLPLVVMLVFGAGPAYRVATRIDDGERGERAVPGHGVTLTWAPAGPGWDRRGAVSWIEALDRCRRLSDDGTRLEDAPRDAWRLPTVDEVVGSLGRHGHNAGGSWDAAARKAAYRIPPDKESPLWDTRSPVVYWWTATEVDARRAFIVVYNGGVHPRAKTLRANTLGFRAVRARPRADGRDTPAGEASHAR